MPGDCAFNLSGYNHAWLLYVHSFNRQTICKKSCILCGIWAKDLQSHHFLDLCHGVHIPVHITPCGLKLAYVASRDIFSSSKELWMSSHRHWFEMEVCIFDENPLGLFQLELYTVFFIRNPFIRNQYSNFSKLKKLSTQIFKVKKLFRAKLSKTTKIH